MRVRLGPVSVSSRGRVGVRAGPISVYGGGGGRRRRPSGNGNGGEGLGAIIAFIVALAVAFVVVVWPLSLWGHAIGLTPSWHQLMNRHKAWLHQHYPLVGLRYLGAAIVLFVVLGLVAWLVSMAFAPQRERRASERLTAAMQEREAQRQLQEVRDRQAAEERRRWLDAPPPPLIPPARFTQDWIDSNVPNLHPGQIPILRQQLKARGWNEEKINVRIGPHLPRDVRR